MTYGLERLCMFVQGKNVLTDWNNEGVKYKMYFFKQKKNFLHIILNLLTQKLY